MVVENRKECLLFPFGLGEMNGRIVLIHLLVWILMVSRIDCRGVLSIKLSEFHNPSGRTFDGGCCDAGRRTDDVYSVCGNDCDYVMRLIVSGLGRANDHVFLFNRPLKYNSNDVIFPHKDYNMVLTVLFDHWPLHDNVKMSAFFYDYDDFDHTTTLVDWFVADLQNDTMESSLDENGISRSQTIIGKRRHNKTKLTFEWSILCNEGAECLTLPSSHDRASPPLTPIFQEFEQVHVGKNSVYNGKLLSNIENNKYSSERNPKIVTSRFPKPNMKNGSQGKRAEIQTSRRRNHRISSIHRQMERSSFPDSLTRKTELPSILPLDEFDKFQRPWFSPSERSISTSGYVENNQNGDNIPDKSSIIGEKYKRLDAIDEGLSAPAAATAPSFIFQRNSMDRQRPSSAIPCLSAFNANLDKDGGRILSHLHNKIDNVDEERSFTNNYTHNSAISNNKRHDKRHKLKTYKNELHRVQNNALPQDDFNKFQNKEKKISGKTISPGRKANMLYLPTSTNSYEKVGEQTNELVGEKHEVAFKTSTISTNRREQNTEYNYYNSSLSTPEVSTHTPLGSSTNATASNQIHRVYFKDRLDQGYVAKIKNKFPYIEIEDILIDDKRQELPLQEWFITRDWKSANFNIMKSNEDSEVVKSVPYSLNGLSKFSRKKNYNSKTTANETLLLAFVKTLVDDKTPSRIQPPIGLNRISNVLSANYQRNREAGLRPKEDPLLGTKNSDLLKELNLGGDVETRSVNNTITLSKNRSESNSNFNTQDVASVDKEIRGTLGTTLGSVLNTKLNKSNHLLPTKISKDISNNLKYNEVSTEDSHSSFLPRIDSRERQGEHVTATNVSAHFTTRSKLLWDDKKTILPGVKANLSNKQSERPERKISRPRDMEILYNSIKKLKAVKFLTQAPVKWVVTGHSAFNKNRYRPRHSSSRNRSTNVILWHTTTAKMPSQEKSAAITPSYISSHEYNIFNEGFKRDLKKMNFRHFQDNHSFVPDERIFTSTTPMISLINHSKNDVKSPSIGTNKTNKRKAEKVETSSRVDINKELSSPESPSLGTNKTNKRKAEKVETPSHMDKNKELSSPERNVNETEHNDTHLNDNRLTSIFKPEILNHPPNKYRGLFLNKQQTPTIASSTPATHTPNIFTQTGTNKKSYHAFNNSLSPSTTANDRMDDPLMLTTIQLKENFISDANKNHSNYSEKVFAYHYQKSTKQKLTRESKTFFKVNKEADIPKRSAYNSLLIKNVNKTRSMVIKQSPIDDIDNDNDVFVVDDDDDDADDDNNDDDGDVDDVNGDIDEEYDDDDDDDDDVDDQNQSEIIDNSNVRKPRIIEENLNVNMITQPVSLKSGQFEDKNTMLPQSTTDRTTDTSEVDTSTSGSSVGIIPHLNEPKIFTVISETKDNDNPGHKRQQTVSKTPNKESNDYQRTREKTYKTVDVFKLLGMLNHTEHNSNVTDIPVVSTHSSEPLKSATKELESPTTPNRIVTTSYPSSISTHNFIKYILAERKPRIKTPPTRFKENLQLKSRNEGDLITQTHPPENSTNDAELPRSTDSVDRMPQPNNDTSWKPFENRKVNGNLWSTVQTNINQFNSSLTHTDHQLPYHKSLKSTLNKYEDENEDLNRNAPQSNWNFQTANYKTTATQSNQTSNIINQRPPFLNRTHIKESLLEHYERNSFNLLNITEFINWVSDQWNSNHNMSDSVGLKTMTGEDLNYYNATKYNTFMPFNNSENILRINLTNNTVKHNHSEIAIATSYKDVVKVAGNLLISLLIQLKGFILSLAGDNSKLRDYSVKMDRNITEKEQIHTTTTPSITGKTDAKSDKNENTKFSISQFITATPISSNPSQNILYDTKTTMKLDTLTSTVLTPVNDPYFPKTRNPIQNTQATQEYKYNEKPKQTLDFGPTASTRRLSQPKISDILFKTPRSFVYIENTMKALPDEGFILHTNAPRKDIHQPPVILPNLPDPKLERTPKAKHVKNLLSSEVDLRKLKDYLHYIRHAPKVDVPSKSLFQEEKVTTPEVENADTPSSEAPRSMNPTMKHRLVDVNLKAVFTRYWPAVFGAIVGTVFLLSALVTSLVCRQRRLLIQRGRWTDSPQHLSEPPDPSEYATSSATSLTSDFARSSTNLV